MATCWGGKASRILTPYALELTKAMDLLEADPRTVFLGQAVKYPGTSMSTTLGNVPDDRKIEMPVCEETQMGLSIGLALAGLIPVTLFTRWNFLLLAANQIVNHLDKFPMISDYRPKVIIRTGIGSIDPMHPGFQHVGDFTGPFRWMCQTVKFVSLQDPEDIVPAYQAAIEHDGSTVLVELSDKFN